MNTRATRILFGLLASALLSVPAVRACMWAYPIWGIRTKPADPLFQFVQKDKVGYIDSSGKIVIPPTILPFFREAGEFHEGLLEVSEEHAARYLDRAGKVVFRVAEVNSARDFSEGMAAAGRSREFPDYGWDFGFIDRTGRFAIPPQYRGVDDFSEGLARVAVSGEFGSTGYIDHSGQFVIPPRLTYGASFHEDRAAVIIDGPCRFAVGNCGRAEFKPSVRDAFYECLYTFIDKKGEPVSNLRFDDAKDFSEGLAPVRIGAEWGYVDRSGQISIPMGFDWAEPFSEGLAAVEKEGKVGFIDHSGRFVIVPQFESVESFSDGRALVRRSRGNGKSTYRFIDKLGHPAFPGEFSVASSFTYGLAHVALSGKGRFAWIDTAGRPVFTYVGSVQI